ncbi:hypothetical protein GN958_ATG16601 [Phytophthora infestans]|uniref:Uncharacterized protein n=1 Tax=Phytophthora infestans TaxID=4787 RepID=A0A8S9U0V5_PHYIN|nr:hypothetical protein GN958_ATG16601 [Phytophthora infestans]
MISKRSPVLQAAQDEAEKASCVDAEKEAAKRHTAAQGDLEPVSGQVHVEAIDDATETTVESGIADVSTASRDAGGTVQQNGNLNETNQEISLHRQTRNDYRPDS